MQPGRQGQWTGMCIYEQWRLHCASQWGWKMPLSEHVHCVAVTFKMTEQVEQQICTKFYINLEHSSTEIFGWFRRPQLWAAGDWQLHHDNMPAHASHLMQNVLAKHQITQVTQPHYSPDLVPFGFWLFPKLKSPLKGKRFQTVDAIHENPTGQLTELCEARQCLLWRGLRRHCSVYNVSCILFLLQ